MIDEMYCWLFVTIVIKNARLSNNTSNVVILIVTSIADRIVRSGIHPMMLFSIKDTKNVNSLVNTNLSPCSHAAFNLLSELEAESRSAYSEVMENLNTKI